MTRSSAEQKMRPRRWFAPRFSLAAALLAMTLCAVGLWYWYRVPFEVVFKSMGNKDIETVRRTWGGTVRHGPRREFRKGKLYLVENYRDGIPHGKWEWLLGEERPYITAEFHLGRLVSFQASDGCDQRLARHLVEGTIDDPKVAKELLFLTRIDFIETPLKDAMRTVMDMHGIPITCQGLRKQVSVPGPIGAPPRTFQLRNLPVTAEAQDVPLIVAFARILQPHGLVCDYRYGMLWIAEREEAENWKDPTGTTELVPPPGSKLAATWEEPNQFDFIETPLRDACAVIGQRHGVKFDLSRVPGPPPDRPLGHMPVNSIVRGLPVKHALGAVLESVDCRARLDGEIIVIELQPGHAPTAKR